MSKELDFRTACIIAGYEYRILYENEIWNISGVDKTDFYLETKDREVYKPFIGIGKDYWILAKDLKEIDLTKFDHEFFKVESDSLILHMRGYDKIDLLDYPIQIIELLYKQHFAINLEKHWWKPVND